MELSVIIPVYNVEKYIRTCIESIYRQGLSEDHFEVILINDGTQDRSMEVIADIIETHKNITVINQENQGLSMARNNGIAIAKGDYILMPDSDDLLVENSLKPLLDKALETRADLVVADFVEIHDEEIAALKPGELRQRERFVCKEMTGKELFLNDLVPYKCYVWRTLYKLDFLKSKKLHFVPGIRYEDLPFTHEVYLKADTCLRASWLLNIYRKGRKGAITLGLDMPRAHDWCVAIGKTWELTHMEGLSTTEMYKLKENLHDSVTALIYSMFYTMKKTTQQLQVLNMLKHEVPELDFDHGLKQRMETWLFWHIPYLYIVLRAYIAKQNKWRRHLLGH